MIALNNRTALHAALVAVLCASTLFLLLGCVGNDAVNANNQVNGFDGKHVTGSPLVIDTTGHDKVIVIADDWFKGTRPVDVYSNVTIQDYKFYRNGTQIRSIATPITYRQGTWNASYVRTTLGTRASGTLASLYSVDANQWQQNDAGGGPNQRADVIASFDQKMIGSVAYASLTDVWINATFSSTGSGTPTEFYLQRWNSGTSAWVNLVSLATWGPHTLRVRFTGGNLTQFTSAMNVITLNHEFRVYARDDNGYQLRVDQMALNYKTSTAITNATGYTLRDSFSINSALLVDGWYNLTARIRDTVGTYHQDTKWVRFDNTVPSFTTSGVSPTGTLYDNESLSILATINEANVNTVVGSYTNAFGIPIMHVEADLSFNHTDVFTNASYSYLLVVTDKAGNTASTTIPFTVVHAVSFIYPTAMIFTQLITDDYSVNVTTSNASSVLIYLDNVLMDTVAGNTTFTKTYNDLTDQTHDAKFEIYDVLGRAWNMTIFEFRVYFAPNIAVFTKLDHRDYFVNISTNHARNVKVYIDAILVDTVPGNTTFTKTYLNLTETTHTSRFDLYDELGVLYNSTQFLFTVEPIIPVYMLFLTTSNSGMDLVIDYWGTYNDYTLFYIDGNFLVNVTGGVSYTNTVTGLSPGIHYIDVEIYDIDGDLSVTKTSTTYISAPAGGSDSSGGNSLKPPEGYPDAPYPPPQTTDGTGSDFILGLTGEASVLLGVVVIAGLATVVLLYNFYQKTKKKRRSRKNSGRRKH